MRLNQVVVDANIVVKWFIEEIDSAKARYIREKYIEGEVELIIPSLLYFEVLNALKYSPLFDQNELNKAGESLENYGFKVVAIKQKIREQMVSIALECDISIYDATYIGLSIEKKTYLFTADEKVIKKLPDKLKKNVKNLSAIDKII
ncbi:MAG: PIN domain-containing protein [Promethearchaeota archaeon]|nr:MAG: PIN domain-containing protein [Candidatus Lokiarchaeota archaeon]